MEEFNATDSTFLLEKEREIFHGEIYETAEG